MFLVPRVYLLPQKKESEDSHHRVESMGSAEVFHLEGVSVSDWDLTLWLFFKKDKNSKQTRKNLPFIGRTVTVLKSNNDHWSAHSN